MREIKFRAFDKEKKEMVPVAGICWHMGKIDDVSTGGIGFGVSHHNAASRYGLMQFTGLRDKNGKEIYEGDVLQTLGPRITVEWHGSIGGEFDCTGYDFTQDDCDEWEVIGNIHENQELVK